MLRNQVAHKCWSQATSCFRSNPPTQKGRTPSRATVLIPPYILEALYDPVSQHLPCQILDQHVTSVETMPSRVLLVTAHPDDESMFFAPSLGHFVRAGSEVAVLCLSNGVGAPQLSHLDRGHRPASAIRCQTSVALITQATPMVWGTCVRRSWWQRAGCCRCAALNSVVSRALGRRRAAEGPDR